MEYPIVIHKEETSDFGVIVPDLPGCFSAGSSLTDAMDNAKEAIECHIEGFMADGDEWGLPSAVDHHQSNPDFAGGIWAVVSVDLAKLSGKAKRINITLPERLLNRIDTYASEHRESRSGFLASAAMEYMSRDHADAGPNT